MTHGHIITAAFHMEYSQLTASLSGGTWGYVRLENYIELFLATNWKEAYLGCMVQCIFNGSS